MKVRQRSEAIREIYKHWYCWRQFLVETRDRGYLTQAVDLTIKGSGHKLMTPNLTAFDIADAEARAWLGYFRGIGAIATAPAGESEAVRNKSQTEEF